MRSPISTRCADHGAGACGCWPKDLAPVLAGGTDLLIRTRHGLVNLGVIHLGTAELGHFLSAQNRSDHRPQPVGRGRRPS
jgi:hypothetical protein